MDETRAAVRVMQDYITEHISEEITIDDLARCSSFSPGYERQLFLKYLGMTPAVYIRRLKLTSISATVKKSAVTYGDCLPALSPLAENLYVCGFLLK